MIGTITFHWGTNYGAVIQAYSLQRAIQGIGYETEIIDYRPRRLLVLRLLYAIKTMNFNQIKKEVKLKAFRKKYLLCSKRKYNNNKELFSISDEYTHIVVGSDQVWNNSFTMGAEGGITLSYFLNFAGESTKRISYATSFGSDSVSEGYIKAVKNDLLKFKNVSVRESSGISIVNRIGQDACLVCDPTALLTADDYSMLIGNRTQNSKYIYLYMLHKNADEVNQIIETIDRQINELPIRTSNCEDILDWLNSIRNAEYVITNSFHGLMFSLIFNTPFVVVPVKGSGMNGRIRTILEILHLTDRIVDEDSISYWDRVISNEIDWKVINVKMAEIRRNGLDYLKKSLGDIDKY